MTGTSERRSGPPGPSLTSRLLDVPASGPPSPLPDRAAPRPNASSPVSYRVRPKVGRDPSSGSTADNRGGVSARFESPILFILGGIGRRGGSRTTFALAYETPLSTSAPD